jgi:hypothetical protein
MRRTYETLDGQRIELEGDQLPLNIAVRNTGHDSWRLATDVERDEGPVTMEAHGLIFQGSTANIAALDRALDNVVVLKKPEPESTDERFRFGNEKEVGP